jgi:protoporphyrinogen/coproporphyrinogen III oxidase
VKADVVVVGGGMGGALVARALRDRHLDVVVADASASPGGVAAPLHRSGYLLEPAVGALRLPHPALSSLLEGLDLETRPAQATARYVRHRGRTVELTPGPRLLAAPLLSWPGKARALAEPFVGHGAAGPATLGDFARRRLGREAGRLGAWLAAAGVHAGDPERLSVEAAFPMLPAMVGAHGSLLRAAVAGRRSGRPGPTTHVVDGGTAALAEAVARSLGDRWLRSWPVETLDASGGRIVARGPGGAEVAAERAVLAVGADQAGLLLGAEVGRHLQDLEYAPVAVVWLGLIEPGLPDALGALVGPDEGFVTLGFLFESSYDSRRAPPGRGLVKAIVGGATRPEAVDLGDAELVERVVTELEAVVGGSVDVEMAEVVRHRPGIPQYTADRARAIAAVGRILPVGVDLAGWEVDGVGVTQLAAAATALADRIVWESAPAGA